MTTIVRFAPSPTGKLHVGNIRTALMNWLYAREKVGKFMLRLDDTDTERSTEEFAEGIREDLHWLGLYWDIEARQSDRLDAYAAAVEKLKEDGKLYPCYETAEELEGKRRRQLAMKKPPVYDRSALKLTDEDRAALEAEGRKPHWRLQLDPVTVEWADLVRGIQKVELSSVSDPVLIRADGSYLYTLPSVVDDIDFGITDIIRGEDHVTNTATQIQLFEALGATPPRFAHHNLLIGGDGQTLSKRSGSLSIESLREAGLEPLAIASHAATIGSSEPVAPHTSMDEIASLFEFGKLSRAPARFDEKELRALNAKLLGLLDFPQVRDPLKEMGIEANPAFWEAVRHNLEILSDAVEWYNIIYTDAKLFLPPSVDDEEFIQTALEHLPPAPFDTSSWKLWTDALKEVTGRNGKRLFQPLRLALTGMERGPELGSLLPLIGEERVRKRLAG